MRLRGLLQHFRRTASIAAASALVVVIASSTALSDAAAAPRAPAPQADAFSNGTAKATALVAKIAPGVGSLELATASGIAVSEVKNDLAQAQAQALDLGLIGTTLTAESCDGGEAHVTPDQLPQPTRVDNREGDAQAQTDQVAVEGSPLGGGRMVVAATEQPLARATATTSAIEVGPVISIGGGRAEATSAIIEGKSREAHAASQATVNIAGIVELRDMRWDALHRTGANPAAAATFELAGANSNGVPLPIDDLGELEAAINQVLAPSGIAVLLPKVERFKEPADLVRVTPLTVILKDSPVGSTVIGPVLNLSRAQRENLFNELAAVYCDLAGALLVGDIGVSIVAGTGFLAVEVGGAEATTGELVLSDPFGTAPPFNGAAPPPVPGGSATPGTPGTPGVPAAPAATPTAPSAPTAPIADVGPLEKLCESVHPFRWPSCSTGAALPLGLIGAAATAGMGVLDWRHQRRRLGAGGSPATSPVPTTA